MTDLIFLSGNVFEVLARGGSREPIPPPIKMLLQIFRLNFSFDMSKMHYFSNKFKKIAKRWGLSALVSIIQKVHVGIIPPKQMHII